MNDLIEELILNNLLFKEKEMLIGRKLTEEEKAEIHRLHANHRERQVA